MHKIAIVDDHHLFRKSLRLLIGSFEGIQVVADAENGKVFLKQLDYIPVDLVLMDIQMPEMNGFETCKILHKEWPKVKIMVLSQLGTNETIQKITELGAHGYISKTAEPEELQKAMSGIMRDGYYYGTALSTVLREALHRQRSRLFDANPEIVTFSEKELAIISLAAQEYNSSEIAIKLSLNIRTVESHRIRIMEKTGSRNFTGAILFALRHYYIPFE